MATLTSTLQQTTQEPVQPTSSTATNPRLRALQSLSAQLPVAQKQVAQGFRDAQMIQMQRAAAAAPAPTAQNAQNMGAMATQQAGAQQVGMAEQGLRNQSQLAEQALQEQRGIVSASTSAQKLAASQEEFQGRARLAGLSEQAATELLDKQMQFQKDELGRTVLNERQLADYAASHAQSQEQFRAYSQQAEQLQRRRQQLMETAYNKLSETLANEQAMRDLKLDQNQKRELYQAKKEIEAELRRNQAEIRNRASIWRSGGSIIGAVAGGVAAAYGSGGSATAAGIAGGAMAGSAIGQGVGGVMAPGDGSAESPQYKGFE